MLEMIAPNGMVVAKGKQISNHLYKLQNLTMITGKDDKATHSFNITEPALIWEIWHKQFGHIAIGGLQTLLTKKLVDGFTMDTKSPKYDCEACVQAKQHIISFPKENSKKLTEPGKLTHMDLWGKYPVQSIHRNYYM